MTNFFSALSTLFRKLETFTTYFSERMTESYQSFGQGQRIALIVFIIIMVLMAWYFFVIMLRLSFKAKTRKLKNVRREYQITLNRANGKYCNFIWDILLYQKVVILDDPLATSEYIENYQKLLTE